MTGTVDGDLTLDVPPLRRDHKVHAWVAARGLSDLGDTVWLIALAWTAVHVAGPALAGLLVGLGTLPRAALMLFGGVFADRWDNRRTVLLTNLARVVVQVAGVVLLSTMAGHTFAILAGVALAFGVADALHNPAASTMSRQMVRPDDLRPLMAVFQTVSRLARLAGAPIGGLLVAAFDVRVAMLVDAASFALIGLVYALWMHPRFPRALSTGTSWRRDLAGGLGLPAAHPGRPFAGGGRLRAQPVRRSRAGGGSRAAGDPRALGCAHARRAGGLRRCRCRRRRDRRRPLEHPPARARRVRDPGRPGRRHRRARVRGPGLRRRGRRVRRASRRVPRRRTSPRCSCSPWTRPTSAGWGR